MESVPAKKADTEAYRFDGFTLRARPLKLYTDGEPAGLQPQATRALWLLLQRAGEVVTREELRQHLWGLETHVDHEQGINFAIRRIRAVLGDEPLAPRYIETVPRQGYRFIADVECGVPEDHLHDTAPQRSSPARRWRRAAVMLLASAALVGGGAWWSAARVEPPPLPLPPPRNDGVLEGLRDTWVQARYLASLDDSAQVARGLALLEELSLEAADAASIHLDLAAAHLRHGSMNGAPFATFMPASADAARRALELDPSLADAHRLLAVAAFFLDHDYAAAGDSLRTALHLDPHLATALHLWGLNRSALGHHDEAISSIRRALELDPASLFLASDLAETYFRARRWDAAMEQARRLLTIDARSSSGHWIIIDSLRREDGAAAMAQVRRYYRAHGLDPPATMDAALDRALAQFESEAAAGVPRYTGQARFALAKGRRDEAIDLLHRACATPDWEIPFITVSPRFDSLHDHPRWRTIPCLVPPRP